MRRLSAKKTTFIKAAFSTILLGVLVYYIDVRAIAGAVSNVNGLYLLAAVVMLVPNIFVQWYKWHLLVRLHDPNVPAGHTFFSLLGGMSLGLVTPGRTGEYGRAVFLDSPGKPQLFAYNVLDKIYTQAALILIGIPSLLYIIRVRFNGMAALYTALWIAYFILLFLIIFVIMNPGRITSRLQGSGSRIFRSPRVRNFIDGLNTFGRAVSIRLFMLSCIFVLVYLMQFYIIISAFAAAPLLSGFTALAAAMLCTTLLPFFFGNLGIRELSAVYFLGGVGIPAFAAFDSSLILFAINVLIPGLTGYFMYMLLPANGTVRDRHIHHKMGAAGGK